MFNNTNAIQTEKPAMLANTMKQYITHKPSILGLIETRRNWRISEKTSVPLRNMATSLQGNKKARTRLVTGNCREAHTSNDICQPGGVAQLTMNRILNLHKRSGADKLGRWVWQEYQVNGIYSLFVITAYRVCPKPPPTSAKTTTWHQQERALRSKGIYDDPRDQFLIDFKKFLLDLKENGNKYIIGWDANAPYDEPEIMDLLQETDMVDPFTDFFAERPATHSRGSMQIDLISMSTSLLQYVDHAFILDPAISESDHSCIGIDFNLGNLLKRRSLRDIDPSHHQNRKLISTDVKARLKYLLELNKKQTGHNIQTRMHDLYDLCESTNQCSDTDRQRFQNIAKQMYTNAKQAEEQCKSAGSFAWSSMLAAAGLAVQLANQELRKLLQGNAPTTSDTSRSSAIARAKHNRDECYEMLYTIQEQADTLRETDIELRIEEEATKNNAPKEAILKAILRREREAEIFPLLSIHVGGKTHNQLDEVWTPNNPQCLDDTTWKSHIEAEAIWEALLSHGKEHFSQASNTPFVSGPIAKFLGPHEWNKVSEQILAGTFDIDSITDDVDVRDIVKAMSHHDPANALTSDSRLTIEKLKDGFKRVKESTSSNPEGLHHGHWKSLIYDDEAFEPFALMIMFAFRWGEPPKVWANSLQICLPKDEPNMPIRINRIRRIQLVCAALNMGFRIIWGHEMMQRAIKAGHVSDYQFGGRSGYMYISAILLK